MLARLIPAFAGNKAEIISFNTVSLGSSLLRERGVCVSFFKINCNVQNRISLIIIDIDYVCPYDFHNKEFVEGLWRHYLFL